MTDSSDALMEAFRPYLQPPQLIETDRVNVSRSTLERLKTLMSYPPALPQARSFMGVPVFVTDDVPPGLVLFVTEEDGVVGEIEIDMGDADYDGEEAP